LEVSDWAVRDADMFAAMTSAEAHTEQDINPLLADSKSHNLAYVKCVGKGRIVHFGFLLPHDSKYNAKSKFQVHPAMHRLITNVCESCAIEPQLRIDDPSIDVTTHISDGKKLIFIANTSDKYKTITLDRVFVDAWHGEHIIGPEISLNPFCVRILEEI
ncbi:MAG: hypothetical protein KAH86_06410, partial [Methanosarcinales archaeon]|nr:hypothetical protein [Methanosarcinales archaeon]